MGQLVIPDQPDQPVTLDRRVPKGTPAHKDPKAFRVSRVISGLPGRPGKMEQPEQSVTLARKGSRATPDLQGKTAAMA